MRLLGLGLLLLAAACQPRRDRPSPSVAVATDSTYHLLDAVMPALVSVVEEAWGTPAGWGRPAGERTTVRLDRTLTDLPDRPFTRMTTTPSPTRLLDSLWVQQWIARGASRAACLSAPTDSCQRGTETMVIHLGTPVWFSSDSAIVNLEMGRPSFGAGFRLTMAKRGGVWRLRSRERRWIT